MRVPPYFLIGSFLAFSEASNMAKAAESIGLSQPSLTNHLKLFETYFTQEVFLMEGRRKKLTSFGGQLRDLFKNRFDNLEYELKALNEKFQSPEDVLIRIAGRAEILSSVANKLDFPGTLIFVPTDGVAAINGIKERRFDLAISNHVSKAGEFHGRKLFSNGFSLFFNKKLVGRDRSLSHRLLVDLSAFPFLSYKEDDENLKIVLKHHRCGSSPKVKRILPDWPTLLAMVQAGQGWTIGPDRYTPSSSQIVAIPISSSLIPATQFYSLYRKESLDHLWFKDLLSQLHQIAL